MGSHLGSLGKNCSDFRVSCDVLAAQFRVVDLAGNGAGPQYLAGGCPPRRIASDQLIAQVLITHDIAHRDIDSFLKELMSLGVIV
jgi:hypothetical protein